MGWTSQEKEFKRLDDGTPSLRAGTRPIGMGEALFKEAWRARASWAARTIGPALLFFGQMAVGLRSGGEGVATALQLYCDSPQLDELGAEGGRSAGGDRDGSLIHRWTNQLGAEGGRFAGGDRGRGRASHLRRLDVRRQRWHREFLN